MVAQFHPWLDTSGAPLYRQIFPKDPALDEMKAFIRSWEETAMSLRTPYGVLCDLSHVISAGAMQRKAMADMDARMAPQDKELCVGTAFIVHSALARGLVTAVYWLSPPVYPYKFFATEIAGRTWLEQMLQERSAQQGL